MSKLSEALNVVVEHLTTQNIEDRECLLQVLSSRANTEDTINITEDTFTINGVKLTPAVKGVEFDQETNTSNNLWITRKKQRIQDALPDALDLIVEHLKTLDSEERAMFYEVLYCRANSKQFKHAESQMTKYELLWFYTKLQGSTDVACRFLCNRAKEELLEDHRFDVDDPEHQEIMNTLKRNQEEQ